MPSTLAVALYTCLWYNLDPSLSMSELQTGCSNQCVKLEYLCIALIPAWMGADSAAALMDAVKRYSVKKMWGWGFANRLTLLSYIIPALFAYFLACHLYIFLHF